MFFTDVMTAIIVATVIMVPLYLTGRTGPWSGRIWFGLVLFLFTWVGGVWGGPYGPVLWGVSWLPFVFFGLIFALLMAAGVPRRLPRGRLFSFRQVVYARVYVSQALPEIDVIGSWQTVWTNCQENFVQIQEFVRSIIDRRTFQIIRSVTRSFLRRRKSLFDQRLLDGKIRECHGDLRTGHIYFTPNGIQVIDCIEFNNAARTLSSLPRNVSDMIKENRDLTDLDGIGKDMAGKIREIIETASLSQLEEIEARTPSELNQLIKISGLGPKRVKALHRNLDINNLQELREAAEKGKIQKLEGFGRKTEQTILEDLERMDGETERIKLPEAEQRAGPLLAYLKKVNGLREIIVAGSFRRRKETVGDLDILVTCKKGSQVMDRFADYEDVRKVISKGKTRSSVVLRSGLQVDLRVVPQVSYGAALHYFTGSKSHNIAVRKLAVKKGLKINEYGVFKKDKRIAGKTEKEVYDTVGLAYIEPELREDRGEVEAAGNSRLPDLITLDELRGDLHTHTKETDGHNSLEEMAKAAQHRGYEYIAITDHSKKVAMAKGLDAGRLKKQIKEIDRLNEKLDGITVFKGIEVDILKDGSLDLPDDILKELDLTVCSVHYNRNLSEKEQTERIIRAMDNPYFNILGHPTGRLINERDPYQVNMEKIMEAARDRGCFLEINAHPDRLDLPGRYCKMARDMGLKMVISTDAHSLADLDFIRFGVDQARRGWLEADDVLNTRSLKQLKELLKRTKH